MVASSVQEPQPEFDPREFGKLYRSLSEEERKEFAGSLTPEQAYAVENLWEVRARPEQLAPEGNWRYWLALAGRGWGKSLAITQWAQSQAIGRPGSRGVFVASTAADLRDVLLNGPSGILVQTPEYERPHWSSTYSRLDWPNGSTALLKSADEPERFRGPAYEWAICDEYCFVAGTKIRTEFGQVNIENIQVGDYVYTRRGLRKVIRSRQTRPDAKVIHIKTVNNMELTGTYEHPVWIYGKNWTKIADIQIGDRLETWQMNPLSGTEKSGGSGQIITRIEKENFSTSPFTNRYMVRFQKVMKFTIKTRIKSITSSTILNFFLVPTTDATTIRKTSRGSSPGQPTGVGNLLKMRGRALNQSPTLVLNAALNSEALGCVQDFALTNASIDFTKNTPTLFGFVISAAKSLKRLRKEQNTALKFVNWPGDLDLASPASSVEHSSILSAQKPEPAPESVPINTEAVVSRIEKQIQTQAVYNLEVEDCHEYYANDILVHNCSWRYPDSFDQMLLGLREGSDPRCAIATTPKPVKHLRELMKREHIVITGGTTYDNRDNLAPAWFEEIISKYKGTRLGKQELDGILLDDNLGALWSSEIIEAGRYRDPSLVPELTRVLVAIDPAVTSNDESSETGIMLGGVAYINRLKHAFLLEDLTMKGSPEEWARVAVNAYHESGADAIVAEVNNGGDLVEAVIHAVDAEANVIQVRASRGKIARAEPVVAYYEQNRVHHVGVFPLLETQQVEWIQGQASPDRIDSCTWLITALMSTEEERIWLRQARARYVTKTSW